MADRLFVAIWPPAREVDALAGALRGAVPADSEMPGTRHGSASLRSASASADLDELGGRLDERTLPRSPNASRDGSQPDLSGGLVPGQARLRWQPPQRWHVTLAFLGNRSPQASAARLDALTLTAAQPVRMRGAGTFGAILWIGLDHGPWLTELADLVQHHLDAGDKRFRAHITVARGRGGPVAAGPARIAARTLSQYSGGLWLPGEITLVGSHMGPNPEYTILNRWQLTGCGTD